jgi:hypothetical protein
MIARRKPATKAEQSYQDCARALGCVVCRWRMDSGYQSTLYGQCGATHLHHRNFNDWHGAKQLGQDAVVALGAWHHDGVLQEGMSTDEMREVYGPSFKFAGDFREWTQDVLPGYGRGTEAWQRYQNELLGEVAE